jgi:hypothetical protein
MKDKNGAKNAKAKPVSNHQLPAICHPERKNMSF